MNDDSRINALRAAVESMRRGEFEIALETGPQDGLGKLSSDVLVLAHTLQRRCAELEALNRLNSILDSSSPLEDVLEQVYGAFRHVIPYDRMGFALLEDEGRTVSARWAKVEYANPRLVQGHSAPVKGSSLQQILESGRPRIINDLRAYYVAHPGSASTRLMVEEGVLSSLTCPVLLDSKPAGFLFFSSRFAKTYEEVHIDTYLRLAEALSGILERNRLQNELRRLRGATSQPL